MLVLNRRVNESLMIGTDVVLTILAINGNETKIGIVAPRDVSVNRQEVSEQMRRNDFRHDESND
jgi:carbon storage regulator